MATANQRVQVWNSFLMYTRLAAEQLYEEVKGSGPKSERDPKGGTLVRQGFAALQTLTLAALMVEARANHLIYELQKERRTINESTAKAALRLNTVSKWAVLPRLANKHIDIDYGQRPHLSIKWLLDHRNAIMHVDFDKLIQVTSKTARDLLTHFPYIIEALSDMNRIVRGETGIRGFHRFGELRPRS